MYFSPRDDHPDQFRVHRDRVCRFFGEYLLQTGTTFDLVSILQTSFFLSCADGETGKR
jgi:hypothetical protein